MTGIASPNVLRAIRAGHNPTQATLDSHAAPVRPQLKCRTIERTRTGAQRDGASPDLVVTKPPPDSGGLAGSARPLRDA